jgi:LCP family protein required for cell wall assembly
VGQGVLQALGEDTSSTTAVTPATAAATTSTSIADPSGMNIVLLGSDTRASSGAGGRSDTIILMHVDSKKGYLSMLSIPRDLYVSIPGHDKNKINTAYNFGGPALVIRTIKSVFNISIDHFVEVDFKAFEQITNRVGGVYVDVDRTYDDGSIQFAPGYQLLDGLNALRYVRTRHDTNYDFGRMERQQRFINALREQAMGWNLPLKLPGLIKDLFSNIDTDLTANEFLKLAYWAVKLDSTRMRQAKIVGSIQTIDGASVVVATDAALKSAITDFLTEPPAVDQDVALTPPADANIKTADLSGVSVNVVNGTGRVGQGALAAVWLMRQGATVLSIKESENPVEGNAVVTYPGSQEDKAATVAGALGIPMTRESGKSSRIMVTLGKAYGISGSQIPAATTTSGTVLNAEQWRSLAGQASFQLVAPTFLPNGVTYSFKRSYSIAAGGKNLPAVRVGYQFGSRDKYMGFSETTWVDAPIASPGWKVKGPGGVIYRLVGTSIKTDHIWWEQNGVLCWVSNTIVFDLPREEMLAAAMSALPVTAAQPAATTSTTAGTSTTEATTTTPATSSTTTTKTGATTTSASSLTPND